MREYTRDFSDAFALDDTVTGVDPAVDKTNVFGLGDSITTTTGFVRSRAHSYGLSDSSTVLVTKGFDDNFDPDERLLSVSQYTRDFSDAFALDDTVTGVDPAVDKTNVFGLGDDIDLTAEFVRPEFDTISASDNTKLSCNLSVPTETQNTSENISKLIFYTRPVSDSIGFSETVTTTLTTGSGLASRTLNGSVINTTTLN